MIAGLPQARVYGQSAQPPQTIQRAPLGPFPQPVTYDHTVPPTVPSGPDLYYYRGQFCGLRMPGAPSVPGGPANPSCIMMCLLDSYPRDWQDKILTTYASYGYTHLQRSRGHSEYYGKSLDEHIELSKRAQDYGLFADEWFLGVQEWQDRNRDFSFWEPWLTATIKPMLDAGVIDTACVGWQLDGFMQSAPGNATISLIAGIAKLLPVGIPLYTHWMNEALAWWKVIGHHPDGRDIGETWSDEYQTIEVKDRFSWWVCMQHYLTGGHHQGNTTLARNNMWVYQGKIRDTLNPFNDGRMGQSQRSGKPFALTVFECTAQDQFDGSCSEDEGDLVGYLVACTKADGHDAWMGGYGNGARRPDGNPL